MVIGKGVLDHFQAPGAQVAEETRGVADPGDRMHWSATKAFQGPCGLLAIDPERLPAERDMNATSWIAGLAVLGLLAVRRGALDEAADHLGNLRRLAIESGEPQRIVPMLCAYLPWALATGQRDELRTVASEALELINSPKITALIVVEKDRPVGIVHFHDLLRAGVA